MVKKNRILGLILAGGRSSRMGRDKATLPFGGARLIDHVAKRLRAALEQDRPSAKGSILVSGHVDGYACVEDRTSGLGPIGGIASVLQSLVVETSGEGGDVAALLVVPVDMPSLTTGVLSRLILEWRKADGDFDGAAFLGRELPVIIAVSTKVFQVLEELCKPETAPESRSVRTLLGTLSMHTVDARNIPGHVFLNANTPGELEGIRN